MPRPKETVTKQQQETSKQQPEMTPEQRRQIELNTQRLEAAQPNLLEMDQLIFDQAGKLLKGEQLSGIFSELGEGISPEAEEELIRRNMEAVRPGLESAGLFNSGIRSELESQAARDILLQGNMEKIRQQENLLNLAQGFPLAAQQPFLQTNQTLAQQLAGLTPVSFSGSQSGGSKFRGPSFGETFGQSAARSGGTAVGTGTAGMIPFF